MYAVREEEDDVPSRAGKRMWYSLRKNNDEGQYDKMGEAVKRDRRVRPATTDIQGTDRVQSSKIRTNVLSVGARAQVLSGPKVACDGGSNALGYGVERLEEGGSKDGGVGLNGF